MEIQLEIPFPSLSFQGSSKVPCRKTWAWAGRRHRTFLGVGALPAKSARGRQLRISRNLLCLRQALWTSSLPSAVRSYFANHSAKAPSALTTAEVIGDENSCEDVQHKSTKQHIRKPLKTLMKIVRRFPDGGTHTATQFLRRTFPEIVALKFSGPAARVFPEHFSG